MFYHKFIFCLELEQKMLVDVFFTIDEICR